MSTFLKKIIVTMFVAMMLNACTTLPRESSITNTDDFLTANQTAAFITKANEQYGLSPNYVTQALKQAVYQAKIITAMQRPYEAQSWAIYKGHMVTPLRVTKGKAFMVTHKQALTYAQNRYGVPTTMIAAIIGVETMYGTNQGNYSVLDALTTLSFAYPKRAAFFQSELANYLVICQKNQWPVRQLKGSYAGAFGIGQFMPSSYRAYAVSASQQTPEISSNYPDAIASVANYFAKHGWQAGEPIAIKVKAPASLLNTALPKLTKPQHSLANWQAKGIVLPVQLKDHTLKAELVVETDSSGHTDAWLIFHNFYVIARYNTSLNYSLAVYCLSEVL